MIALATLLLATSLSAPSTTLVLKTGERIETDGPVRQESDRIVFREAGGALYSIALSDLDMTASGSATRKDPSSARVTAADASWRERAAEEETLRLRVSQAERARLLHELEQNHSGKPAPPSRIVDVVAATAPSETRETKEEEWSWRARSRQFEEQLRQAKENLQLAQERAALLQDQIRGFLSLGYQPRDFTYQTTQLQNTVDSLPYLQLEVTRADRALQQFREDARRQGILPGWLR